MRTFSLRQRLLQNLIAVLLPLAVLVSAIAVLATRMAAEDMAQSLIRHSIEQTAAELELYFASIDRLIGAAQDWTRTGLLDLDDSQGLRQLMQPLLANEPQLSSFLIADQQGRELMLVQADSGWRLRRVDPRDPGRVRWLGWQGGPEAATTESVDVQAYDPPYDPRAQPWFTGALEGQDQHQEQRVAWTGPYALLTTHDPGITASAAVPGPEDQLQVVALDVLLLDIRRFTRELLLSKQGGVVLLDDQERLIGLPGDRHLSGVEDERARQRLGWPHAASDDASTWPPLLEAASAFKRDSGEAIELVRFSSMDEVWWGAREPFALGSDKHLWIQVLVPESELLGRLSALPYAVMLVLILVLAAAAWRMQAVSSRFSRPIEALVDASERLRLGDFRPSTPLNTRITELQRLQQAQERMRVGLAALMRLERDLQLAREIQQAALPKQIPPLTGFDLEVWTEPADETGGDTYDVIAREADATAVLMLADATGHGIGPALTATEVRSLLRMAVRVGQDLSQIASQINDQLNEDLDQGRFVTAWLAEVDCERRRVRSLSAGQAPILVLRQATGNCEVLGADGPPLGLFPGIAPQARDWCEMAAGDLVAVISDGIYEAANPADEQFGIERTIAVVRANAGRPALAIREALLRRLAEFTQDRAADDDRTILILKATDERCRR